MKYRALVVEDEWDIACLYSEYMKSLFDVEIVHRISEAVARLSDTSKTKVDVIILDLKLPNGEGVECIRLFQSQFPNIPMVVVTGTDVSPQKAIGAGAHDLILKPNVNEYRLRERAAMAIFRHKVRPLYKACDSQIEFLQRTNTESAQRIDEALSRNPSSK